MIKSSDLFFSDVNPEQIEAIKTTDGPVLITAGPGTGKTHTLIKRALYLILGKGVKPEQILMATFTEKAAKELVTRLSNELAKFDVPVNINEMYIGTFHSICLRIIKENLEYTKLKKNFKTLDDFDQKYIIFRNMWQFKSIPNISLVCKTRGDWNQALEICTLINSITEELVDTQKLLASGNAKFIALANVIEKYKEILISNNYLDFSGIQTETYSLLVSNQNVLEGVREQIQYMMIDEYQDTNYIQEQLVFLLAGDNHNICVVGDDDQGLYRFRGATIRNILEFPDKFAANECTIVKLIKNYRSNSDIVEFYNNWMQTTWFGKAGFTWDKYRYEKTIVPVNYSKMTSPAVIRITADDDVDDWYSNNLAFVRMLLDSGKVSDLNQIAFLFKSVKNEKVQGLAEYFEENGVNVYSPRSDLFFYRYEVRLLIGCLLACFTDFCYNLEDRNFSFLDEQLCEYYDDCLELLGEYLETSEGEPLSNLLAEFADTLSFMAKNTDYAFTGLTYRLLAHEPFASMLGIDMCCGVKDQRPARNLALMTSILAKYEYLHRVDVFTPKKKDKDVEMFFNLYLKLLMRGGIGEYEDETEYAPSGCVSFLTIHQSKGMEFPIVVVGSLGNVPREQKNEILNEIAPQYFHRPPFEPFADIKWFDFWRLYYTAFSRAQNLLVLTCNITSKQPSKYFRLSFNDLMDYDSENFNIDEFDIEVVKDVNIKDSYSFTSHIAVYEECALQYKFFKELGFTPIRVGATIFGTIVHETIEDIHKAALRGEEHLITSENIRDWLAINYSSISKAEHAYLGEKQINSAYNQILNYVNKHADDWSIIKEAEVDVSLVKDEYILSGKIDLIRSDDGTVEIVDFKAEQKPDVEEQATYYERYKKQLQVYAHLVEERTGNQVSKLTLYYTGDNSGKPTISFPYIKADVKKTINEFDAVVHKIKCKDFSGRTTNQKTCANCDFRHYCKK